MLSLTRPGGWAFGEILTSAQVEALDASQAKAIDGTGGGTYTPSVKIIINGQGLQVNTLTVTGTLSLLGNTTVGNASTDAFSVLATSTFSAPVTLNDALVANEVADFYNGVIVHSGGELLASGDAVFGDGPARVFTVNGTGTFNAPVTLNDTIEIYGDTTCHSGTRFWAAGDVILGNDASKTLSIFAALATSLAYTGDGRIPLSNGGTLPNHDTTLTAGQAQLWRINPAATDFRQYTLSTSGAVDGDWILFWQGSGNSSVSSHGAQIVSPTPEQSTTGALFTGKNSQFALYVFIGGGWYLALSSTFI